MNVRRSKWKHGGFYRMTTTTWLFGCFSLSCRRSLHAARCWCRVTAFLFATASSSKHSTLVFMPSLNICANPHLSHWHVDDGLARRSLCFAKLRALFLVAMKLILRETSQCLVFSVFNSCRSSCSLVLVQRKAGRPDWQVVVGWSLGQASLGMGGICLREINFKAIWHMKFFWLTPKIFCILWLCYITDREVVHINETGVRVWSGKCTFSTVIILQ